MTSKAKSKGNGWEREICKFFGETFGGNFERVPNSGAMTGGLNSHRLSYLTASQKLIYKGDIIPDDSMPRLVVEAKFYKDFPFNQLLLNSGIKKLDNWIAQSIEPTEENDVWFLCIKINHKGKFVVFPKEYLTTISFDRITNYSIYKDEYVVTSFDDFFTDNAQKIKDACK